MHGYLLFPAQDISQFTTPTSKDFRSMEATAASVEAEVLGLAEPSSCERECWCSRTRLLMATMQPAETAAKKGMGTRVGEVVVAA